MRNYNKIGNKKKKSLEIIGFAGKQKRRVFKSYQGSTQHVESFAIGVQILQIIISQSLKDISTNQDGIEGGDAQTSQKSLNPTERPRKPGNTCFARNWC